MRMREVNSLAYSINQQMSTTTLALLLLLQRDVYVYKYLPLSLDALILSMALFLSTFTEQSARRQIRCLFVTRTAARLPLKFNAVRIE